MFGRELRELFRLAVPLAAAQAGTQLMTVVDIAVLGRYSARALAASGVANALFFAVSILGMGVVMGIDPLISQALGAKNRIAARHVLWQGVWLALVTTAVLTVLLIASPMLLPIIGVEEELIAPGTTYLLIRTIGLAPFLLFIVLRAYLQAHGNTRPLLTAMIVCNIFNLAADIVLVFGGTVLPSWSGPLRAIPPMGVAGAAVATVAGSLIQLWIAAAAVRRMPLHEPEPAHMRRWSGEEVARAFRIGWPVSLQMGAEVGIFALVALLAGRLGTNQVAAHQVVIALASFTFTVALGVAAAGSVRVGLAIGAGDAVRTRAAGFAALLGGALVMATSGMVFALLPRPLGMLLTDDQAVIAVAVPLFLVAAVFQLSDGLQAVGAGILRGAADTRFALIANLVGHWLVGFPIALLLGFRMGMGVVGLWWGLSAGLTVVAILLVMRFSKLSARAIAPV